MRTCRETCSESSLTLAVSPLVRGQEDQPKNNSAQLVSHSFFFCKITENVTNKGSTSIIIRHISYVCKYLLLKGNWGGKNNFSAKVLSLSCTNNSTILYSYFVSLKFTSCCELGLVMTWKVLPVQAS